MARYSEDSIGIRNRVAHGIMATHGIMPHGIAPN
jgi:hypothetical protein